MDVLGGGELDQRDAAVQLGAAWGGGISVDAQDPKHVIVSTLDWYNPDRLLMTINGGTSWSVIGQPPTASNTAGSTYDAGGAAYWFSGGAQIGTNATNWVEAVALDPFNANHAMHGTGAGIWSSSNIGSATGTSGQGVTWSFTDQGLEETVPLFMLPSVSGAFLGAIGASAACATATSTATPRPASTPTRPSPTSTGSTSRRAIRTSWCASATAARSPPTSPTRPTTA